MAKHMQQSALRYPLTGILGSVSTVGTLRELMRHGGELSAPSLVTRTGLSKASVRQALRLLVALNVVEALGSERSRLYRARLAHPLAAALDALFLEEEKRFEAVLDAIRTAAGRCDGLVAAWLYGSVARSQDGPASDVDVAVVGEPGSVPRIEQALREALRDAEAGLFFRASVVAVDGEDVLRLCAENDHWWAGLVRDALRLVGDPPDRLIERLKRQQSAARRRAS